MVAARPGSPPGSSARLRSRPWVPDTSEQVVHDHATRTADRGPADNLAHVLRLVERNREIHDVECLNLNPAANTMHPVAESLLASGLGSRPSLGYPGDKYEMGLEAIEEIEVVAAELAAEVFHAPYVEVRCGSGALANLYVFMACCRAGDRIVAPPATIGGHVTHHRAGAAGWFGVTTVDAAIDAGRYTVDVDAVARQARERRPAVLTIGGSLNLGHHPVAELREIADDVGATLLFDAAHLSGLIAGGAWPNPLDEGAHVMTMSAYKSLAGPPSGLVCTTEAAIAERLDAIAFPGLTANFDAANTAALAVTLVEWIERGGDAAADMVTAATRLADLLDERGVPVWRTADGSATRSHAFAVDAGAGGGHSVARRLRTANLLTSAIGLPHDAGAGVRIGVNEVVRCGAGPDEIDRIGEVFAAAWHADDARLVELAEEVSAIRTSLRPAWS